MVFRLLRRRWRVQYGGNEKLHNILYLPSCLHGCCTASVKWRGGRTALVVQSASYFYNDDNNNNNEYSLLIYIHIYYNRRGGRGNVRRTVAVLSRRTLKTRGV